AKRQRRRASDVWLRFALSVVAGQVNQLVERMAEVIPPSLACWQANDRASTATASSGSGKILPEPSQATRSGRSPWRAPQAESRDRVSRRWSLQELPSPQRLSGAQIVSIDIGAASPIVPTIVVP